MKDQKTYDKSKRQIEKQIDLQQRETDGKKIKVKSKYFNKDELSPEEEEKEGRKSRKSRK